MLHTITKCVFEDLKPSNICMTKASGRLEYKLIDFSSCVELLQSEEPGQLRTTAQSIGGTRGYMAPEAAAGQAHSASADTYSLGE
jgi:serine/threonine protein kinase